MRVLLFSLSAVSRKKPMSLLFAGLCLAVATNSRAVTIVNVDARVNAVNNPVQITLGTGSWLVTPIDVSGGGTYTAWSPWAYNEPEGCGPYDCVTGWVNGYKVASASLGEITISNIGIYATPELAFADASSRGFTLDQTEVVSFYINDSPDSLSDNRGGMSFAIVPEPSTALLLATGLAGLGAAGRRRSLH